MMAVCIAGCEQSFSKVKLVLSYLQASMTKNKSGQTVWSSFDEYRKGHFMNFNQKRLDILMFRWNCVFFKHNKVHDLHLKFIVQSKLYVFF